MKIECVPVGLFQTNCYLVTDKDFVLVIDPGDKVDVLKRKLIDPPTHIVLTHAHFDHVGALNALALMYPNAKIFAHEDENTDPQYVLSMAGLFTARRMEKNGFTMPLSIERLKDGDIICNMRIIHTPGHTQGSVCLYSESENILFSGDTLFFHSRGRTDLGGKEEDIYKSLAKILMLKPDTLVYPGHGCATTIEEEREYQDFFSPAFLHSTQSNA